MLRILERVAGPTIGIVGRGSVTERLRSNGVEIFRGIAGVTPSVAEYWIKAIEKIMDDLDCTPQKKLKGTVSLLRDEAYQWWLTVKEGTQADRLTCEFIKTTFQDKYVCSSYVDGRRREFLNLTHGDKTVAEYKAEFLRLSRYARGMVATEYERYIRFEDGLKDSLQIAKDVKRTEHQDREKERGRNKRDSEPLSSLMRPKKKPRIDGPIRVEAPIAVIGPQPCADCGRRHQGECWRRIGTCFRFRSLEHRIRDCP
ncbi:uncharacterized protein LOC108485162 [Gossypium arboreum]|uniref:uncharacterized protein LOC108485162 n=1 Tax=Gossypium arboreum TaxID=29729 RepID=UPI00081904B3|nr:uncharacterized protein LOC108485162 [Gossypium arboreum]